MSIEQDSINPTMLQVRLDREESDNWKLMTSRHTKGHIRGNIKAKEIVIIYSYVKCYETLLKKL
jgi:hypothetical protein